MHEVAKVLEFQLQHQSFQGNPRVDLQNGLVGSPCSPRDSHPAARGPSAAETGPGVQRRGPGTDRDLSIIAGRDWGQEKGTTEDEMAGWHH